MFFRSFWEVITVKKQGNTCDNILTQTFTSCFSKVICCAFPLHLYKVILNTCTLYPTTCIPLLCFIYCFLNKKVVFYFFELMKNPLQYCLYIINNPDGICFMYVKKLCCSYSPDWFSVFDQENGVTWDSKIVIENRSSSAVKRIQRKEKETGSTLFQYGLNNASSSFRVFLVSCASNMPLQPGKGCWGIKVSGLNPAWPWGKPLLQNAATFSSILCHDK